MEGAGVGEGGEVGELGDGHVRVTPRMRLLRPCSVTQFLRGRIIMENCGDVSTNIPDEIHKPADRRNTVVALEAVINPIWVMPVNMPIKNYGEFEEGEAAVGEGVDGEEEAAEILEIAEYLFEEMCLDGFVPGGGVFPDSEVTHRGGSFCCLIVPGNHTGHI